MKNTDHSPVSKNHSIEVLKTRVRSLTIRRNKRLREVANIFTEIAAFDAQIKLEKAKLAAIPRVDCSSIVQRLLAQAAMQEFMDIPNSVTMPKAAPVAAPADDLEALLRGL